MKTERACLRETAIDPETLQESPLRLSSRNRFLKFEGHCASWHEYCRLGCLKLRIAQGCQWSSFIRSTKSAYQQSYRVENTICVIYSASEWLHATYLQCFRVQICNHESCIFLGCHFLANALLVLHMRNLVHTSVVG